MQSSPRSWVWFDVGVVSLIAAFGAVQVLLHVRVNDFLHDDVFYFEAARSLLHGFYGFNGRPETNQPPGLPAILALLCLTGANSLASFLRAMALFQTAGIAASYVLFRRQLPRTVAASICLILISAPLYFPLETGWVATCFPLLLTTTLALLVSHRIEEAAESIARLVWVVLLALLVSASLMIASASIAFLAAIVMVVGIELFRDPRLALNRLKWYGAVLLVGITVQGLLMYRRPAPLEWPLPGYPRPYMEQLKVKDGNYPELGMATARDIPERIARNMFDQSVLLTESLYPLWVNVHWASLIILGPLLLVVLGWGSRVWKTGGTFQDWYFAGYQGIYLLWPWKTELRFFLPIAPLACLYLWHGAKALRLLVQSRPRQIGLLWLPFGLFLAAGAWFWERGSWLGRNTLIHGGLQDDLSLVVWVASVFLAGRMVWTGHTVNATKNLAFRWFAQIGRVLRVGPYRLAQGLAGLVVVALIVLGLQGELAIGRENLNFNLASRGVPADVLAGLWINSNTPPDAIIMAVQVPTVYYYAKRKTVWFPPSTNARILMEGIERNHVQYVVVVVKRFKPYYLPPDDDCFESLNNAYPSVFRLVAQGAAGQRSQFRIFQVFAGHTRNLMTSKSHE